MVIINLTPQELFDRACEHIAAQGEFGKDKNCISKYRCTGVSGKKVMCLIGGIIPKEDYDKSWDTISNSVDTLIVDGQLHFPQATRNFMYALQSCHDNAMTSDEMCSALRGLAYNYYLDASKVDLIKW